MPEDAKETAYQLGKDAFTNGKTCVPAKDNALMAMVQAINKFGEGAKLCKAWSDGWIAASLKTPV